MKEKRYHSLPPVTDDMRLWLNSLLYKLNLLQRDVVAADSTKQFSASWLSQLLSGHRRFVSQKHMAHLHRVLLHFLNDYSGPEKEVLMEEMSSRFAKFAELPAVSDDSTTDPLHFAADLFALLSEWCPERDRRAQAIEHMRLANNLSSPESK